MFETDPPPGRESPASPEVLTRLCSELQPAQGIDILVDAVNGMMPGLQARVALSRGGWYRLGGVVDGNYTRVSRNIVHWVEDQCGGDIDTLLATFDGAGYFATRFMGKTHFITVPRGPEPQDFLQIEVEELQEALDRPLVDPDWQPDSVEEFLDPIDYPRLEPEPVDEPFYQFRRITSVGDLLCHAGDIHHDGDLQRFFADWRASSAGEKAVFCDHWVLALREYRDREGLQRLTAKPVATFDGRLPELPQGDAHGVSLANAIHGYDRHLGYPFAWYFMMLGEKAGNYSLAQAVLADQMGAYEYLPARDLRVLRQWETRPYAV